MVRYIVRPSGILTTPQRLKDTLEAQRIVLHCHPTKRFSSDTDFFLSYPRPSQVDVGNTPVYLALRSFFVADKFEQRRLIHSAGIKTPRTLGIDHDTTDIRETFVIRPKRHRGGEGFRVGPPVYDPRTEYAAELFPKTREYRVIYCRGQKVATLYKRRPDSVTVDQPWNHTSGCRFCTLSDEGRTRLARYTSFYTDVLNSEIVQHADLVAIDVMLSEDNRYAVCEFNFCPSISIPTTLSKIKEIVHV